MIGIENIPIYQAIPDIIQKEFYFKQYNIPHRNLYNYVLVDSVSKNLPSIVVITSGELETKVYKTSPKKSLIARIEKEGYKKIVVFYPDFRYYKFLGNNIDYAFTGMVVSPPTTAIYKK